MSFPNNLFWLRLTGTIALETAAVIGLVFALQYWVHSVNWRRALWQIGMATMLLLLVSDLTGVGRGIATVLLGKPHVARTVSVNISDVAPELSNSIAPNAAKTTVGPIAHSSPVWWPAVLWGTGFGLVMLRVAVAHGLMLTLRWRRPEIADDDLAHTANEIAKGFGIRQKIRLIHAPGLTSPIAFGLVQPCIGLPSGFSQDFSSEQQDAMLAHELGHLVGRDPIWHLLADVAVALLWWQPLVWMARRQLHATSELAADEATALIDNGPESLAECLVRLAKQATQTPRWGWMGVDGGYRSNLGQRVLRLLALREKSQPRVGNGPRFLVRTSAMLGLGLGIVFLAGWLQGQGLAKKESWQATLKQSWDSSAGGAIMITADQPEPPKTNTPALAEPPQLYTKNFRLEQRAVQEHLEISPAELATTNAKGRVISALRAQFEKAGIDLNQNGKTVLYNPVNGMLLVRASLSDLTIVENVVNEINRTPPQLVLEAKLVEVNEATAREFSGPLGSTNILTTIMPDSSGRFGADALITSETNVIGQRGGILSESQSRIALSKIQVLDIISAPKVVTLSGRQAHISTERASALPAQSDTPTPGLAFDLVPTVQADGIAVKLILIVTETRKLENSNGFGQSRLIGQYSVPDGNTMFLQALFPSGGTEPNKHLLVFVTPTLIDPAGNRLHAPVDQ